MCCFSPRVDGLQQDYRGNRGDCESSKEMQWDARGSAGPGRSTDKIELGADCRIGEGLGKHRQLRDACRARDDMRQLTGIDTIECAIGKTGKRICACVRARR